MARVPIEVVVVGVNDLAGVPSAIALSNAEQDEFRFDAAPEDIQREMQLHAYAQVQSEDFFDQLERVRTGMRGFHPFIIATTAQMADVIVPKDRMVAYFIYYFARYVLSFLLPGHRNHDDARGCVFDRKINKRDIVKSMHARALCDDCRRALVSDGGMLSGAQFVALERYVYA
jgi:hypothetical protein